ncbi:hypothetical protein [Streptomyces prunicolor]|uniref:hypothetical protein n=1 Tax=Streptomyces prunicolor TaxID=67348 RepID=UPI00036D24B8|nr:hypothetical protein [Streptomyces prunicolor]
MHQAIPRRDEVPGRGSAVLGVLRIRDYRLVAAGQLLSSLGDWLLLVAARSSCSA